jgi:hypothetical protein
MRAYTHVEYMTHHIASNSMLRFFYVVCLIGKPVHVSSLRNPQNQMADDGSITTVQ